MNAASDAPAASDEVSSGGTISRQVDPSLPGNFLHSHGMRVTIAETVNSTSGDSRPSLGIDISPEPSGGPSFSPNSGTASKEDNAPTEDPQAANTAGTDTAAAGNQTSPTSKGGNATSAQNSPALSDTNSEPRDRWGLTAEEEQFRIKWGWAALDEARSAAREQAGK